MGMRVWQTFASKMGLKKRLQDFMSIVSYAAVIIGTGHYLVAGGGGGWGVGGGGVTKY